MEQELDNMDVLSKIERMYNDLSEISKKIADVILVDPEKIIHLTISQLADLCGVSEASVVRFSKQLGCSGFNEMKINMAIGLIPADYWVQEDVGEDDDEETLVKKVFLNGIQAMQNTQKSLDIQAFRRAVSVISHSRSIQFFAAGNSQPLALDSTYRFLCIGIPAYTNVDIANSLIQATMMAPHDVAIGVSHSGSTKSTVEALEKAKTSGAATICITGYDKSPITQVADICLASESSETALSNMGMFSRIAQMSVLDALYVGVAFRRLEYSKQHIKFANKIMAHEKF